MYCAPLKDLMTCCLLYQLPCSFAFPSCDKCCDYRMCVYCKIKMLHDAFPFSPAPRMHVECKSTQGGDVERVKRKAEQKSTISSHRKAKQLTTQNRTKQALSLWHLVYPPLSPSYMSFSFVCAEVRVFPSSLIVRCLYASSSIFGAK